MGLSIKRLMRLQRIRSLEEQEARTELERANLALKVADEAVGNQLLQRTAARRASREALMTGDREKWHMAEATREVSEWNLVKLTTLREVRAAAVEPARVVFIEKRRDDEQMKILRKNMQSEVDTEMKRHEQQAADEWFAQGRSRTGTEEGRDS